MDQRSRACGGSACFFDWRRFAVLVPEAEAAHVPALLAAMPRARVEVMHGELMTSNASRNAQGRSCDFRTFMYFIRCHFSQAWF